MEYTAVIRTLGTAGEKYRQLLYSLDKQTVRPREIIVYIAEGYPLPKETIGYERYVYVEKGMVAQRALRYEEVKTEYILFLDDDLYLSEDAVMTLYRHLVANDADVISPDVFPNAKRSFWGKIMMAVSGRMMARRDDGKWGYKVMRNGGYSYNSRPVSEVYLSQTNAGACFFCSKSNFLKIRFEEELWLDKLKYPLGEDQIMFYKMYLTGLKLLTWFGSGIVHLDGGNNLQNKAKSRSLVYADLRFKIIFWHRFVFLPESSVVLKLWDIACLAYLLVFTIVVSLVKFNFDILKLKLKAIKDGYDFIKSGEYRSIPLITKKLCNKD